MMSQSLLLLQDGGVNDQLSPGTTVFTVNCTIHTRVFFGGCQGADSGQQTVTFESTRAAATNAQLLQHAHASSLKQGKAGSPTRSQGIPSSPP